jgi:uncharacterized membrane protein (UPF0127 family)
MLRGNLASRMTNSRRILSRLLIACAALTAAAALPGCGREAKPAEAKTIADYFAVRIGDRPTRLQVAVLEPEMQRGLMDRPSLGRDEGMAFVYTQPRQVSFWMHNTLIPLDIGFFDAKGELREVRQMYPHDERSVPSHSAEIQLAVEMNLNWFRDNGVKPGMKLDTAALKAALEARGFVVRKFGLE